MSRPIHFELPADQPERAVKFYEQAFGWRIQKWEGPIPYWLITTGEGEPGIDGAIMHREEPVAHTVNTISVPSLDESLAKIVAAGGKVLGPKTTIPGVGYHAYCQDTEGNVFGILQTDTSAK
jgi:predicted enzyme related to lactoylglutathione lyase